MVILHDTRGGRKVGMLCICGYPSFIMFNILSRRYDHRTNDDKD